VSLPAGPNEKCRIALEFSDSLIVGSTFLLLLECELHAELIFESAFCVSNSLYFIFIAIFYSCVLSQNLFAYACIYPNKIILKNNRVIKH
jgi:hypothetical protein